MAFAVHHALKEFGAHCAVSGACDITISASSLAKGRAFVDDALRARGTVAQAISGADMQSGGSVQHHEIARHVTTLA